MSLKELEALVLALRDGVNTNITTIVGDLKWLTGRLEVLSLDIKQLNIRLAKTTEKKILPKPASRVNALPKQPLSGGLNKRTKRTKRK
jgi:hypothetical protein